MGVEKVVVECRGKVDAGSNGGRNGRLYINAFWPPVVLFDLLLQPFKLIPMRYLANLQRLPQCPRFSVQPTTSSRPTASFKSNLCWWGFSFYSDSRLKHLAPTYLLRLSAWFPLHSRMPLLYTKFPCRSILSWSEIAILESARTEGGSDKDDFVHRTTHYHVSRPEKHERLPCSWIVHFSIQWMSICNNSSLLIEEFHFSLLHSNSPHFFSSQPHISAARVACTCERKTG